MEDAMREKMKGLISILLVITLVFTDNSFIAISNATSTVEQISNEEKIEGVESIEIEDTKTTSEQNTEQISSEEETEEESSETSNADEKIELTTEDLQSDDKKTNESESMVTSEEQQEKDSQALESDKEKYNWQEYVEINVPNYTDLSKEEKLAVYQEYCSYLSAFNKTEEGEYINSTNGIFSNEYLEVVLDTTGKFTIGNVEGNPNYDSDNEEKLLYGHPSPGTSETLIKIGSSEYWFQADSISWTSNSAIASMIIEECDIQIVQILEFCKSGNVDYDDMVRISYQVINNGSQEQSVGVRVMLDTMLANNDEAPFKIPGVGNVTTVSRYEGTAIPSGYQVYDDLDFPTTIATGYLYREGERKPDVVHFTQWRDVDDSDWNYNSIVGEDLGDTAVAIYYNPVNLLAGKSMEVATYYGVSVGSKMDGSSNLTVDSKTATIQVKDNTTNKMIEGAEIRMTVEGETPKIASTDGNGLATFNNMSSVVNSATLVVCKEGYQTRTSQVDIKGGSRISISLKDSNDTTPIIESVTLGGKDILNSTVHYIENKNKIIEKGKNIKNATLKITADMTDVTYYLVEDEKVIDHNKTGEFIIKTATTSSGTVIDKFASGGNRYVKCVSKDGKSSKKVKIGIKVSAPTVTASKIQGADLWPYGKANVATGTLGALLLGDSVSFGLGKSEKLDLKIEVTEEGKVRVGLNFDKMPQSEEDTKKIFEALSKAGLKGTLKKKYVKQSHKVSLGAVRPSVDIYGYGEGIIKDKAVQVDLAIRIEGKVDASYTTNYYFVVPLYITVGAGGGIAVEVKANVHNKQGWQLAVYSGTIEPSVYLSVEGGVGTKGLVSAGVKGKGTLKYQYDFVDKQSKATLKGEASIVVGAGPFEKDLPFAEATVKIYDSNDKEGTTYGLDQENIYDLLEETPFRLKNRIYLQENENVEGGLTDDEDLVLKNVSEDAAPINLQVGDATYKFWLQSNLERNVVNGNMLVYSVCKDGTWSQAFAVEDDGTADYGVDVVEENGVIYVVWYDTNAQFEDETAEINTVMKTSEVKLATIDTLKGTTKVITLTDNQKIDAEPAVTVMDGSVYIVWYATDNDVLENVESNYICYTTVSGESVGELKEIDCGTDDISQISAMIMDGTPTAIYTLTKASDTFEEVGTIHYLPMTGTESKELTSVEDGETGEIVISSLLGETTMFWYQNQNIWYSNDVSNKQAVFVLDEEVTNSISNEFSVADNGKETYIVWKGATEEGTAIYTICYSNGQWGNVYKLKDVTEGQIRDLTTIFGQSGDLELSYMKVLYDEENNIIQSSMVHEKVQAQADLVLTELEYDSELAKTGELLPITLYVTNAGNKTIDAVTVEITDMNGESYVKTIEQLNLPAGENTELLIEDFAIISDISNNETLSYDVSVYTTGDVNVENGKSSFVVGYTTILAETDTNVMIDGEEYYPIRIANTSKITADNVRVKVLADSIDGAIIYDNHMGTLDAGTEKYIYISSSDLSNCSQYYVYITTDTPEDVVGDNYYMFACSDETILYVTENQLTIVAEEGGSVITGTSGLYSTYDEIPLEVEAEEGYVFNGWEVSSGLIEEDGTSAMFYMPDEGATVTATFIKDEKTTSVVLDQTELKVSVGEISELIATTVPETNNKQLIWTSSNAEVVSVNQKGKITANKAGTAVITVAATNNDKVIAECEVTVEDIKITSIEMVYPEIELQGIDATEVLDVNLEPENATESIIWSSSNSEIITVTDDGMIKAVGVGEATIYAKSSEKQAICKVTVNNSLLSISFDKNRLKLNQGEEGDVTVLYNPINATDETTVVWTNFSENVVNITSAGDKQQNLHVEALNSGTALIQASVNGLKAYLIVEVYIPATGIGLSESEITLAEEDYYYMDYNIFPSNSTDEIQWESSDESVVYVSDYGSIEGRSVGTATVTATTTSGQKASVVVNVTPKIYDTVVVAGSTCSSLHPYENFTEKIWKITRPGAQNIQITFSAETELEDGYDYITIMDQNFKSIGVYTGTELAGKTITVEGPIAQVKLTTDSSIQEYGFDVVNVVASYNINNAKIDDLPIQYYTGSKVMPKLTVRIGQTILIQGVHYTVTYSNNVDVGVATAVVKAIAPNSGKITMQYPIMLPTLDSVKNLKQEKTTTKSVVLKWDKMDYAQGYYVYKYDSKKKKYTLLKTLVGKENTSYTIKKLKKSTKYKYAIKAFVNSGNNKSEGPMAYITISTCTAKPTLKAKTGKKVVSLSWKKVKGANGYEIYMSSKKKSGYKKKATITKASTLKKTIKKLKSGKTQYFKIRTYIKTSSGKVYSDFSKPIKVKIK